MFCKKGKEKKGQKQNKGLALPERKTERMPETSTLAPVLLNSNDLPEREALQLGEICKQPKVNLTGRKRRNFRTTKVGLKLSIDKWKVTTKHGYIELRWYIDRSIQGKRWGHRCEQFHRTGTLHRHYLSLGIDAQEERHMTEIIKILLINLHFGEHIDTMNPLEAWIVFYNSTTICTS